jgi:Mn2+/Fe2+ NRAMP family transporter
MGAAVQMLVGGPLVAYTIGFGVLCLLLEIFLSYRRYAAILKFTTLSLFAYVAVVFTVHVPWAEALKSLLIPHVEWTAVFATGFVAILGTTISPYLFFWQAAQRSRRSGTTRSLSTSRREGRFRNGQDPSDTFR